MVCICITFLLDMHVPQKTLKTAISENNANMTCKKVKNRNNKIARSHFMLGTFNLLSFKVTMLTTIHQHSVLPFPCTKKRWVINQSQLNWSAIVKDLFLMITLERTVTISGFSIMFCLKLSGVVHSTIDVQRSFRNWTTLTECFSFSKMRNKLSSGALRGLKKG